jgi:hypothetical protein
MSISKCTTFGVVEGFYWEQEHSYHGQYGEYTHTQRRKLLQFMAAKGLNVYAYAPKVFMLGPKERKERAIQLLQEDDLKEWRKTFKLAKTLNIDFIWGLTPPDCAESTIRKLKMVIKQLTTPENKGASVALLFDDAGGMGSDESIQGQAKLVNELYLEFKNKVKAYGPACYHGNPEDLQNQLKYSHEVIQKEIPFIFTGLEINSNEIKKGDLPHFEGRKTILWDNWIGIDSLNFEKNFTSPPLYREDLSSLSGYWLNLAFPVERSIPAISSIALLRLHQRSPSPERVDDLLFEEGGIADDWALEMGCSVNLTRTILKIKFEDRNAAINPNIDDIMITSDLHSLCLLLTNGLKINALVKPGKTIMQLAIDHNNYPLAKFLENRVDPILITHINWETVKEKWSSSFPHPQMNNKLSTDYRFDLVTSVDSYNLKTLQMYLQMGVTPLTKNSNECSLSECASWRAQKNHDSKYADLAKFLKVLEDFEEEKNTLSNKK